MVKLTANEIMRYGAKTTREQSLIEFIIGIEDKLEAANEKLSNIEDLGCDNCHTLRAEIRELEELLEEHGIDYD